MTQHFFSLLPFHSRSCKCKLSLTGSVRRDSNILRIRYELQDPLGQVLLPKPTLVPQRRGRLWETTCFEFFIAPSEAENYWEFNFSPAGHWNAYTFDSYRQGMCEVTTLDHLPLVIQRNDEQFQLSVDLDVYNLLRPDQTMQIGISAVLESTDNQLSYWALSHGGPVPDFHDLSGFVLTL